MQRILLIFLSCGDNRSHFKVKIILINNYNLFSSFSNIEVNLPFEFDFSLLKTCVGMCPY